MHKVTQVEYEEFMGHCLELQDRWRLHEYDLTFDRLDDDDTLANITVDDEASMATIRLCKKMREIDREMGFEALARHEMGHLVAGRMHGLAQSRYTTEKEISAEYERMAIKMAKLLP